MTPAAEPRVSVVAATRDRPGRLAALLDALRAQTLGEAEFEVVVVDDGSGAETIALLENARERDDLALRVVRHDAPRGPGGARNAGWRAARGALVAFTDDDCRPAPGWLEAGLAAHEHAPEAVVQGRTEPDPGGARPARAVLAHGARRAPRSAVRDVQHLLSARAARAPRGLRRGLRPAAAGRGTGGGEDTDLAWRAIELGRPTAFCEKALVFHAVLDLGPLGALRDATRWTETVRVFARHPGARTMLDHRAFWNVWHYLLVRSLLALLLPRRLRALRWAILARHALALNDRARTLGGGPRLLPLLVLYDVVETIAVARGAARHRTLVL